MKFATIRDLRTKTRALREELKSAREIVLTANGRPFAVMVTVDPDSLEETIREIRLARARRAIDRIQARSKELGLDRMTMTEIDALIAEVRREKRAGK